MKNIVLKSIVISNIIFFSGCSLKDYKLFQAESVKEEKTTIINDEKYLKELKYENKIKPNDRLSITVYVQSGQGSQQMSSILTSRTDDSITTKMMI